MTHEERLGLWQARLAEYDASGLPMGDWCKKHGFRADQLRYWLRKFRQSQQSQSWTFLDLIDDESVADPMSLPGTPKSSSPTTTDDTGISVRIGSACVEVRPGFNPSLLSEVLRVVAATC